jgi:hypothetical protein
MCRWRRACLRFGRQSRSRRALASRDSVATPGPVTADYCLRAEQSSDPSPPQSTSTTPAIDVSALARTTAISALSHPGEAAASRNYSVRGKGVASGSTTPAIALREPITRMAEPRRSIRAGGQADAWRRR